MEEVYDNLSNYNFRTSLWDINTKIGRYMEGHNRRGSKHQLNNNGMRLTEFGEGKIMKIMNMYSKRRDIYKGTWLVPNREYTKQIVHILVDKKYQGVVRNVTL